MRLPEWIRTHYHADLHNTKHLLRRHRLSTVCEEARCPNKGECFSKPTATFMILGSNCTRNCGFCSVRTSTPEAVDPTEPENVAEAAKEMGLRYVVITSVTRDDLPDGGAEQFARTIRAVREKIPYAKIEVLTPDFKGDPDSLSAVIKAGPDVYNHNIETVERLYPNVRPQADYRRSLFILMKAGEFSAGANIKSGLMLGLGEGLDEVLYALEDLRKAGCDFVTIGQYLRPTIHNLPVVKYILPEVFEDLKVRASAMGFKYVASGPMVRSSMNAEEMYNTSGIKRVLKK